MVVHNVSKPLSSLMSNDFMKEAAEKTCPLEEEDSTTFAYFVEWAYTGSYRVHLRRGTTGVNAEENDETRYSSRPKPSGRLCYYYCTLCGYRSRVEYDSDNRFPFCTKCTSTRHCVGCNGTLNRAENRSYVCLSCSQSHNLELVDIRADSAYRVELFKRKEYPVDGRNHRRIRNALDAKIPTDRPSNDLLAHARLFIFADKWLVSPLRELTLHKLHRDLSEYSIEEHGIIELIRILKYCFYELPAGDERSPESREDSQPTNFSELKELIITYAACRSEEFMKYTEFRTMLKECGEVALQFIDAANKRFV